MLISGLIKVKNLKKKKMDNKKKSEIQKEIVANLPLKPHGRMLLAPRVGKSKLAIDIIKINKPKSILWVTPSAKLAEEDIPEEFTTWKAKSYVKKLTTVTWMSLDKIEGHFDMIILDEEQFATENNLSGLIGGKITYDYILSMTGTPTKHEDKIKLYQALNLEILYELNITGAVDIGILSNYKIKVFEIDMLPEKVIPAGNKLKPFMQSEADAYRYLTSTMQQALIQRRKDASFRIMARMRFIKNSPSKLKSMKNLLPKLEGRIMIFCATIAQAEELCEHTYHSKTTMEDYKRFQAGEIDRIAMVNAGGTGHTYKGIDHLVLVQADSDKNGLTSQKICRTLLEQPDYEATIWIGSLIGTQDEKWVESALQNFDKTKVEYVRSKNYK